MTRTNRVSDHPTLLLIDDCVQQRDLYELALAGDFDILTATRGDDGLALAGSTHPDAIILDVMMPGIDGWETCTRLKCDDATADIPVILLTASDGMNLSDRAMAVGASSILRKPCSPDRLKLAVLAALPHSTPRLIPS